MKKILILALSLSLIFTGCAKDKKIQKKTYQVIKKSQKNQTKKIILR